MLDIIKKGISHPEKTIENLGRLELLNWMSDELYLKLLYFFAFRKRLNLKDPVLFSEKLQWLKLHDRSPLYTTLVDKYEFKKYVANNLGERYVIPTLGVWDTFDEIDFGKLPNKFVLKCTHDSGGIVICTNKNKLDKKEARKKLNKCLNHNFYYFGREWPYRDVKPHIIAEEYMEELNKTDLIDYKFYCFDGVPQFCQTVSNRFSNETIDFFDMDWTLQEFTGLTDGVEMSAVAPSKPKKFNEMKSVVKCIAPKNPFSRVDLYEINDQIFLGEITFYPNSGLGRFRPQIWNKYIGDMINIKGINDSI